MYVCKYMYIHMHASTIEHLANGVGAHTEHAVMSMYVYEYSYAYVYVYIFMYGYMYMYMYTDVCITTHKYVHIYNMYTHVCTNTHQYVHIYACTYLTMPGQRR